MPLALWLLCRLNDVLHGDSPTAGPAVRDQLAQALGKLVGGAMQQGDAQLTAAGLPPLAAKLVLYKLFARMTRGVTCC